MNFLCVYDGTSKLVSSKYLFFNTTTTHAYKISLYLQIFCKYKNFILKKFQKNIIFLEYYPEPITWASYMIQPYIPENKASKNIQSLKIHYNLNINKQ